MSSHWVPMTLIYPSSAHQLGRSLLDGYAGWIGQMSDPAAQPILRNQAQQKSNRRVERPVHHTGCDEDGKYHAEAKLEARDYTGKLRKKRNEQLSAGERRDWQETQHRKSRADPDGGLDQRKCAGRRRERQ